MEAAYAIAAIMFAIAVGAISPGPSFLLVARISVSRSRRQGLAAALGMGLGGALLATLAVIGLQAVFARFEWLYLALKIGGGLYLLYLAYLLWRGAKEPLSSAEGDMGDEGWMRSFWFAFITQISNPKTVIVYSSIFAALLPASPPSWAMIILPPLLFAVEGSWYAIVALAFSAARPRAAYLRGKGWVDRTAGVLMAALGLRLLFGSAKLA
ncbi:LysE family translocator [Dongia sp.]|uniref:LysE family translocator n=1 Tax=Dongia sp. TaxID=1977262 RepID=UPI0035B064BC